MPFIAFQLLRYLVRLFLPIYRKAEYQRSPQSWKIGYSFKIHKQQDFPILFPILYVVYSFVVLTGTTVRFENVPRNVLNSPSLYPTVHTSRFGGNAKRSSTKPAPSRKSERARFALLHGVRIWVLHTRECNSITAKPPSFSRVRARSKCIFEGDTLYEIHAHIWWLEGIASSRKVH